MLVLSEQCWTQRFRVWFHMDPRKAGNLSSFARIQPAIISSFLPIFPLIAAGRGFGWQGQHTETDNRSHLVLPVYLPWFWFARHPEATGSGCAHPFKIKRQWKTTTMNIIYIHKLYIHECMSASGAQTLISSPLRSRRWHSVLKCKILRLKWFLLRLCPPPKKKRGKKMC